MQHPYQCIAAIESTAQGQASSHLLAACGHRLVLVDVNDSKIITEWFSAISTTNTAEAPENDDGERPKKKQKTVPPVKPANIIKLTVSPDQAHAVAVTDDKYVRVFTIGNGKLEEISQRCMPKRPCAVQVLPDNATIICGDKFGDVYSLPLLPTASEDVPMVADTALESATLEADEPAFKPSATNLTVHTKRNRKALEAQMQQKAFSAKKEPLKFDHKLLLGHVSMLTGVAYASRNVDGRDRGYIITADRDEHIRISRGPPQSHVIEGYCLGHKEFVSKLCLIPGTDLSVSGGGENELYVWDWPAFTLKRKIHLTDEVVNTGESNAEASRQADDGTMSQADSSKKDVAVSGMWIVPCPAAHGGTETALVVAIERLPMLLAIPVNQLGLPRGQDVNITTIDLGHAPLDLACIGDSVVVSLDAREEGQSRFQAIKLQEVQEQGMIGNVRDGEMEKRLACLNSYPTADASLDGKTLDDLLYNVGNLRKRRGWGDSAKEGDDGPDGDAGVDDVAED
ncbi:tRNA (guanine-N(7)-)-methyltransferase non-catalytic subunit trm82 [Elasticomyces elasticus]|nr:tRNA (guanine-N(7)-)-methyltransferase non-catalytic subunit trm82 [Elasticomyces elasticus]KAK3657063.1 tRNA (guanine-N(7)-)-methyltransferase non-catalytic subunit trm82 [Elasticomyces elasticus]KAK4926708.1 tRNA (guanine-N(7)-)-methyltransferase non-catalytic subunit trm82 [Elasticomyces elasticus]KAK5762341.1 tRNA (guanine-N(7)-)-methyltransferase non-catalytic subunit trm82 [Elasticomyces elasticus]